MNATQQAAAIPMPAITTPAAARTFAGHLVDVMNDLLRIVESETELVRAGGVRDALLLESRKAELSRAYLAAIGQLKINRRYLEQAEPELLATLHRHHDVFRAMLQVNLTVLATAHAVSEGIIRGVNSELQRRSMPQTYTAAGQRSAAGSRHAAPLAVSRSL
jgi:hypothetical protein